MYITSSHALFSKPFLACQNSLKLTYSNLEFEIFPGRIPGPSAFRRGGNGREEMAGRVNGRGGREGKERGGEVPPQTEIYHYTTHLTFMKTC